MVNGKSLVAWLIHELGLSGYPGIVDAANEFLANPSSANAWKLGFHIFWALASGHRALKILKNVV